MARHTAPDDRSFQRSLTKAVGRAALLLAVVGGIVLLLTQLRPGGEETVLTDTGSEAGSEAVGSSEAAGTPGAPATGTDGSEDPLAALPSDDPDRRTVPIDPGATAAASPGAAPAPAAAEEPVAPTTDPPDQVTVQVLRGTDDEDAFDAAVRDIRTLGYQVELIAVAGTGSPTTTVYATEGNEAEAEALRVADPRFAQVAPNERFETPVDLHIVVGEDWQDG